MLFRYHVNFKSSIQMKGSSSHKRKEKSIPNSNIIYIKFTDDEPILTTKTQESIETFKVRDVGICLSIWWAYMLML